MDNVDAKAQIMRAIGFMETELPASWAGPAMWADVTQQAAHLILDLRKHLSPAHLAVLMSIGAVAHRQCKLEQGQQKGDSDHV